MNNIIIYLEFGLIFGLSFLIAYFSMKVKLKVFIKILINCAGLLVVWLCIIATGMKEMSVFLYLFLLPVTIFGILMRFISPIILNLTGKLVAKITKQDYEWQTYDQIMADDSGGKGYFCVLTFTMMKVLLYLFIILSFIGII